MGRLERGLGLGTSFDLLSKTAQPAPKNIDLYFCGFPCQPWSRANARSTLWEHPSAQLVFGLADTLQQVRPNSAILENVLGLKTAGLRSPLPCFSSVTSVSIWWGVQGLGGWGVREPRPFVLFVC